VKGKYKIITTMLIFGSIGVFVKGIDLTSSEIAFLRGMIGSIFLILASLILMNKFIKNLTGFETTLVQLLVAAVVLFPYVISRDHLDFSGLNSTEDSCGSTGQGRPCRRDSAEEAPRTAREPLAPGAQINRQVSKNAYV
jgi:hypothetical protein